MDVSRRLRDLHCFKHLGDCGWFFRTPHKPPDGESLGFVHNRYDMLSTEKKNGFFFVFFVQKLR
jgi:hypothetical protein